MAKQEFVNHHNLELLRAALPFMRPSVQKSVEVISKAEDLMSSMQTDPSGGDFTTMSLSSAPVNVEDVLLQIKSVGNKREQEMIDNVINLMKMQKLFQNYHSFMNAHPSNNSSGSAAGSQDTLMEFMLSQLSPDQKSNFENINMVFNSMNS